MEFINNFTKDYGYALTTARFKRDKGDGEIKVIYLHCDRVYIGAGSTKGTGQTEEFAP